MLKKIQKRIIKRLKLLIINKKLVPEGDSSEKRKGLEPWVYQITVFDNEIHIAYCMSFIKHQNILYAICISLSKLGF